MVVQQHTRIWRYFGQMKLLNKRLPRGAPRGLKLMLRQRLRKGLELPTGSRSFPKAPPGAFKTAWGWRRMVATWPKR